MKIALIVAPQFPSSFESIKAHLEEVGNEVLVVEYSKGIRQTLIDELPQVCYVDASLGEALIPLGELLECLGIEYAGSSAFVRTMTADPRAVAHNLGVFTDLTGEYATAGVSHGMYISTQISSMLEAQELSRLVKSRIPGGYPVWVQNTTSSTVGVINSEEEMKAVLQAASETNTALFVSSYSEGVALTVPVLGSGANAYALCPIELETLEAVRSEVLSHDVGSAEAIRCEIERAALEVYQASGLLDYGCVDVLWDGAQVAIVRLNPSPAIVGKTPFSQACKVAGISLPGLFDALLSA